MGVWHFSRVVAGAKEMTSRDGVVKIARKGISGGEVASGAYERPHGNWGETASVVEGLGKGWENLNSREIRYGAVRC